MTGGCSIVIVSYNSESQVSACLSSLVAHPPGGEYEIIVVDNASRDDTVGRIRSEFPSVRLIASETNDGYGVAVNRAMAGASGDYLVFLNPDARVTAGALDTLIRHASHPHVGVVGPRLLTDSGVPQPSGRRFPAPWRTLWEVSRLHLLLPNQRRADVLLGTYWDQSQTRRVDWVSGACHVLRREVWNRVGPVTEETFCGFDDFDYCWRTTKLGYQTWLVADSVVFHSVGSSVSQRWSPPEVETLAINNMFVLLEGLWPSWRWRALAAAEAIAALSDWAQALTSATGRSLAPQIWARMSLLLKLAAGVMSPARRWGAPSVFQ
jgi:GT2 family glycosyltransferase